MERKSREMLLVGIALVVMAGLFVWPATRWLIRLQLVSQIVPSHVDHAALDRRVAEGSPQDFQIQYVHALTTPAPASSASENSAIRLLSSLTPDSQCIERLRGLEARFPNEPTLYAHVLRYATRGQVHLRRREQDELSLISQKHNETVKDALLSEHLASFDRDAAQGERLDPNNAYFPLMRAAGLFEAGRDADAIAAIRRAGQATRYEDYVGEEFYSLDRFRALAYGESGALARVSVAAAILFPHYAELRAMCRMGVVSAIHAEQSHNAQAGFAIRRDLAHAGGLMRVQGHSLICSLVGMAITSITMSRPGGTPLVKTDDTGHMTEAQREARQQEKLNKYCAYLRSIGHDDEARWMIVEMDAIKQAKDISKKAGDADVGAFSMTPMRDLCLWWAANLLTLTNALGLLILGAFAAIAAHVSPGKRLLLWRIAFSCLVVLVFGLWLWNVERSISDWVATPFQLTQSLSGSDTDSASYGGVEMAARIVTIVCALALPLGMLGVISIISLCTRVPLATGIGRGLRGLALPVACALFLAYAAQTAGTLRQEARVNASLHAGMRSEGAANAAALGRTWPGVTP